MAAPSGFHLVFILLICLATTCVPVEVAELELALTVLRARGHTLYSNAIATSDVLHEIVNRNSSFTFLAPTDSALFALDMVNTASDYTAALRCHIVPLRLSFNQLYRFPTGDTLRTLFRNHQIQVENRRSNPPFSGANGFTSIDGVLVVSPGLFYSENIAVYGLGGTVNCFRSDRETPLASPSLDSNASGFCGMNFYGNNTQSPKVNRCRHPPQANFTSNRNRAKTPSSYYGHMPAYSPAKDQFPPAYNIWPGFPTSSTVSSRTEHPAPEDSEPATYSLHSSETVRSRPPAYKIWPRIGTTSEFIPAIEPPLPEFSENDDRTLFPPDRAQISAVGGED